jgi:hypothetical protein
MRNGFYTTLTIACILCAVFVWWPQDAKSPSLMSVAEQQQELVRRGHDIKVDGKFGKNTDLALNIELTKERK